MKLLLITSVNLLLAVVILSSRSETETQPLRSQKMDKTNTLMLCPKEHQRPADQTFLTYPEWFLVYSPDEYAQFIASHNSDDFPYFGHIRQFWQSYWAVFQATKTYQYPFNTGYHVMVMVIGGSTTVEYALRACYEKTIGRLAILTRTHGPTSEDTFAATVAQEYVDFIKVLPWYEFDFVDKLKRLWRDNKPMEQDLIRKWERRFFLSTEYMVKAGYGWLIKKMTKASYEDPLPVTAVFTNENSGSLQLLPRYDAFKDSILALAIKGENFTEIAGNRDVILVTYLVPSAWHPVGKDYGVLFAQPILTRPTEKRVAITCSVSKLGQVLREFSIPGYKLEHVYDY